MAITQDYVSAAGTEGNDYKGASFTDGAYTSATKTLTKAGAFAASKVNHWLYLTDNGSATVTAGYYRITSVAGAPNAVVIHADCSNDNADVADVVCTQHAGTALLPWRSLQGAFDLCTRNATDGNQVNLKSGTPHVNAAALDLATFISGGALGASAPLIVRGYTAAANDGGVGEINCGGYTMWVDATADYIIMADLEIHSGGDNDTVAMDLACMLFRCEVHEGASTPSATKYLVKLSGNYSNIIGCYIHDTPARGINTGAYGYVYGNYIADCDVYGLVASGNGNVVEGNVVKLSAAGAIGLYGASLGTRLIRNAVYNSAAGTAGGIAFTNTNGLAMNNTVEGFSGAGGKGIYSTVDGPIYGFNGFYNNTAPYAIIDMTFIDLTANDIALAASPFTDPANGDFSLTAAGKTALRGLGWPAAYLGAHASTDGHVTIGPVQYGEAEAGGSGGMLVGNKRGNKE
ncbi:MAG: hypothetical protein PHU53_07930 [Thermoplasmata archaeon]|nr:hypothetical protein [Thermoplasmata archaeon]